VRSIGKKRHPHSAVTGVNIACPKDLGFDHRSDPSDNKTSDSPCCGPLQCFLNDLTTRQEEAIKKASREITMLVLLGRGLPMDSKQFLPMITAWPTVVFLKYFKSAGRYQGIWLPAPITLWWFIATIQEIFILILIRIVSQYLDGRLVHHSFLPLFFFRRFLFW
jgi:hypothetical protein